MARDRAVGSNDKVSATAEKAAVGVMGGAQEAADRLRSSAERAAEHIPDAVAGAQVAARDTQRVLEEMPNQALIVGTSFSLGLGVGLLLTGSNRLLVVAALLPAAAMAATLMSREGGQPTSRRLSS
ncbi:MAG: hypothetical protein M3253_04985 [Chloroflexota bacterium]|nr:hypothetical protein [Chloroflexota bacterium]